MHYDITRDASIEKFIEFLDENCKDYKIKKNGKIIELKQDDYKGKRVRLTISDSSYTVNFKLDIGVHSYMFIPQKEACFSFDDKNKCMLKVNPPEQMVIEKLQSLLKHGIASTRYKDILDIHYLISNNKLRKGLMIKCIKHLGNIASKDIANKIANILRNENYKARFMTSEKWLDVKYEDIINTISAYFRELD